MDTTHDIGQHLRSEKKIKSFGISLIYRNFQTFMLFLFERS